jgi:5-methylcytosine-specific restriction endonuclease McrA
MTTVDHVFPKSRGGAPGRRNHLFVCSQCNNDKASLTLREFLARLENKGDKRANHVRVVVNKFDMGIWIE